MTDRTIAVPSGRVSRIAVATALSAVAGVAGAADWSVDPLVTLNADYDDNNRLTSVPQQEVEVFGALLDAEVTFSAATPRTNFRLVPRVRATFYPDESDEQTDSEFLFADYQFRGERYDGEFDVQLSRRETLGRYLPDDFDDDGGIPGDGDDLGNTPEPNVQDRIAVTPGINFELTERTRLELGAGYLDVAFDEQVENDREDYNSVSGDVGLRYLLSTTKSIALRALARQYEPDDGAATDSQALELEWVNRVSETSRAYVRAGSNRVEEIDEFGESDWNTGFTGGAGVSWAFEVTDLFLDFERGLDPNSSGRLVERDEARFRLNRRLSPVTTLLLAARAVRDGKTNAQDVFQEREYLAASVGFEWRMTRKFTLGGGYEYVWRSIEDQPEDAQSNRLYFGVTWEPNRL
jgi:hypothetical protein